MLFNIALLAGAVNCLTALAAPTAPTPEATGVLSPPEFIFAPNGPGSFRTKEEVHAALEKAISSADRKRSTDNGVHELEARVTGMVPGKTYTWNGWAVVAGQVLIEQYGGTSWAFPTDATSIGYICDQVAASLTGIIGNGEVERNVGGGWTWHGQILQNNYEFNGMPYNLVYGLVYDAVLAASGWITWDNAFDFIIHDTNGLAILELQVYPTIRGALVVWHDEL